MRLGFFASHGGSSMKSIVQACRKGDLSAEPCLMFGNNPRSKAIAWAEENNLPAFRINDAAFADKVAQTQFILDKLKEYNVTHICLSGYMKMIDPLILQAYKNRIINIHPSLLPKHGGKGMYGLHVHEAVLANKESQTGITLHLVNEVYDDGEIIDQLCIDVDCDDPIELQKKVGALEPEFYIKTLQKIESGEIDLDQVASKS